MNVKRKLMLHLALIVMATMLASCSCLERRSMPSPQPTTTFATVTPPIPTAITALELNGATETLTVQFDPQKGTCLNVTTSKGVDVSCDDVQIKLDQLFICTLKSKAEWHKHKVNTFIDETAIPGFLDEGNGVYCAPVQYISDGAIFQFKPESDGNNISCRNTGGGPPICPR